MDRHRSLLILAALYLVLPAAPGGAQAGPLQIPRFTPEAGAGIFTDRDSYRDPCEVLSHAEEEALFDALRTITAELRRLPLLNPPPNLEVRAYRNVTHHYAGPCPAPGEAVWGDLYMQIFHPDYERAGRHAQGAVTVWLNPRLKQIHFTDSLGPTYLRAPPTLRVAGHDVFGQFAPGSSVRVYITPGDRQLWRPVTRERVLRHRLAGLRQSPGTTAAAGSVLETWLRDAPKRESDRQKTFRSLAGVIPAAELAALREQMERGEREVTEELRRDDPAMRRVYAEGRAHAEARVAELEAELAGMTPAERSSPAWIGPSQKLSGLVGAGDEGAVMVVEPNPDFYDRSLPRTAVQAMVVEFRTHRNPYVLAYTGALYQAMDWAALTRLLATSRR
jgi:hypothetical protein